MKKHIENAKKAIAILDTISNKLDALHDRLQKAEDAQFKKAA